MSLMEDLARQNGLRKVAKLAGRRDAAGLTRMLEDQDSGVGDAAESALVELGPSSVDALVATLGRLLQDWHWRVARALNTIDDDRALEPLARVVDECTTCGLEPASFLARRRDPRAVPTLVKRLSNSDTKEEARLLGEIGDASAVQPLLALLERLEKRQNAYSSRAEKPVDQQAVSQIDYFFGDSDNSATAPDVLDGLDENPFLNALAATLVAEEIDPVLQALEQIGTPEARAGVEAYRSRNA